MFDQTYDGVKRVLTSSVGVTGKLSPQKNGDKIFGPVSIVLMVLAGGGGTGYIGLQTLESSAFTLATANAAELSAQRKAVASIDVLHIEVGILKTNQIAIKAAIETSRVEARDDFRELARLIRGTSHD